MFSGDAAATTDARNSISFQSVTSLARAPVPLPTIRTARPTVPSKHLFIKALLVWRSPPRGHALRGTGVESKRTPPSAQVVEAATQQRAISDWVGSDVESYLSVC